MGERTHGEREGAFTRREELHGDDVAEPAAVRAVEDLRHRLARLRLECVRLDVILALDAVLRGRKAPGRRGGWRRQGKLGLRVSPAATPRAREQKGRECLHLQTEKNRPTQRLVSSVFVRHEPSSAMEKCSSFS